MSIIRDFLPVLNKHKIHFIRKQQMGGDVVAFEFHSAENVVWKPGQHGLFIHDTVKVKGRSFRGFSIASGPNEDVIRIATRIREPLSDFKNQMMCLKEGDTMVMRGPFGAFCITDTESPVLFIAGGIGITPFLGILRYFNEHILETPKSLVLVYSQNANQHAFRSEIENLNSNIDNLTLHFVVHRDDIIEAINTFVSEHENTGNYFISGTGRMIRSVKKTLKRLGIHGRNIKSDWFFGY